MTKNKYKKNIYLSNIQILFLNTFSALNARTLKYDSHANK